MVASVRSFLVPIYRFVLKNKRFSIDLFLKVKTEGKGEQDPWSASADPPACTCSSNVASSQETSFAFESLSCLTRVVVICGFVAYVACAFLGFVTYTLSIVSYLEPTNEILFFFFRSNIILFEQCNTDLLTEILTY